MQVIRNIDYLFEAPHMSAVIADRFNEPGLTKLNSGIMVIVPNYEEFNGMTKLVNSGRVSLSNMGDQDIIRAYYKNWHMELRLSLPSGLNVFYQEVSAGVIKKKM